MFAFSAVFDEVLYRPSDSEDIPQYAEIQRVLKVSSRVRRTLDG
jgi:hypothetical protein